MLNEMRFGTMSESTIKAFKALNRDVTYEDGVQPTELYACLLLFIDMFI